MTSLKIALAALHGVGDARLGEWRERGRGATVHIRRRLSVAEAARVPPLRDIRGTQEEADRITALLHDAPELRDAIARMRA